MFAPWLARIVKANHARQAVLNSAEVELVFELGALTAPGSEVTPRTVTLMLNRTLQIFRQTYSVYSCISSFGPQNSFFFVAWVVEQSDKLCSNFISPVLLRIRNADPVTILATIEAARRQN